MSSTKRKLNLTVDEEVVLRAKRFAEKRGESLSSFVEKFLARLVVDDTDMGQDWLERFHQRFLGPQHREPSDQELDQLREGIQDKYS